MSNPVFSQSAMERDTVMGTEPMTINGAINKTFVLLACLILTSAYVWNLFYQGYTDKVYFLGIVGFVLGIVSFIMIIFMRKTIHIAAPIYALSQGLFIGGMSAAFDKLMPGVVIQAILGTMTALFSMLFLYRIGAIRCTEKFRSVVFIATLSIAGVYLVSFIGSFFGMQVPGIFSSGSTGIVFSLVVIVIASLNLIMDFDFIEQGAQNMFDKSFEWYGAFGLLVTLVWLYIEFLRLFAKLKDR